MNIFIISFFSCLCVAYNAYNNLHKYIHLYVLIKKVLNQNTFNTHKIVKMIIKSPFFDQPQMTSFKFWLKLSSNNKNRLLNVTS